MRVRNFGHLSKPTHMDHGVLRRVSHWYNIERCLRLWHFLFMFTSQWGEGSQWALWGWSKSSKWKRWLRSSAEVKIKLGCIIIRFAISALSRWVSTLPMMSNSKGHSATSAMSNRVPIVISVVLDINTVTSWLSWGPPSNECGIKGVFLFWICSE